MLRNPCMDHISRASKYASETSPWGVAQTLGAIVGIARIIVDLGGRALDWIASALYLAGNCFYYCYAFCASNPERNTSKTAKLMSIHTDNLVKTTCAVVSLDGIMRIVKAAFLGVFGPIFDPTQARRYNRDSNIHWNEAKTLRKYRDWGCNGVFDTKTAFPT